MAKCFFTGVELLIEDAYVLDISSSYRALKKFRQRVISMEWLIQQLGTYDNVDVYNPKKQRKVKRKYRRLISPAVAEALAAAYPEDTIFIKWFEWKKRRKFLIKDIIEGRVSERTNESSALIGVT